MQRTENVMVVKAFVCMLNDFSFRPTNQYNTVWLLISRGNKHREK